MRDVWFDGGPPHGPAFDPVFTTRLRGLAPDVLGDLVDPTDTWYTDHGDLFVVTPRWRGGWAQHPSPRVTLQVRWADGQLTGCWADDHLWDDVDLRDPGALVVRGVRMDPEDAASATCRWLARELGGPVRHETWVRQGRVVAERWAISGGPALVHRGPWWIRRGEPTTIVVAT